MTVRIARGNELRKIRTFINKDGTLSNTEEALRKARFNVGAGRNNPQAETGKERKTITKAS